MPQLQGLLLATGRQTCHLVSWSPSGCNVFEVRREPLYQAAMLEYLVAFSRAALGRRPLACAELERASAMRAWSKQLAREAPLVGAIAAADCVALSPRQRGSGEDDDDARAAAGRGGSAHGASSGVGPRVVGATALRADVAS